MSSPTPVLPSGSLILITGITGLIGSHVADQLLAKGYRVRGTSRDASAASWLTEMFQKRHPNCHIELVSIPDMSASPHVYDQALQDVSGICHVASDLTMNPDPDKVVTPTVANLRTIMAATAQHSSVKRFVYTSSSAAITSPKPGVKFHIDASVWNEEDLRDAWAPPPHDPSHGFTVYSASKAAAEQAAWQFMRDHRPHYDLNTILPNFNVGNILSPNNQSGTTTSLVRSIFRNGDLRDCSFIPPQWMVNVQDTARLHVAALLDPEVKGQRIFAYAEPFNWTRVLRLFRELYPERKFGEDPQDEKEDLMTLDTTESERLLNRWFGQTEGFVGLKESLRMATSDLIN